ncbi:MAG TPA: hypothetical protein VGU20_16230, partial [Stellaceae bacterium]|nr:hypothetical protein [Stellaceae bacterium]
IEWGEGALKQGSFVIPRGAKDAYWGQKFLALMTDPKASAIYANALAYAGLNPDSLHWDSLPTAHHASACQVAAL